MKNRGTKSLRPPVLLAVMVAAILSCFPLVWVVLVLSENRTGVTLVALQQEDISEITIFDSASSQRSLLATFSSPKDNDIIYEFVQAINESRPGDLYYRELILSPELYLVINLNNGEKPFELVFYRHEDCRKNVYIDVIRTLDPGKYKMGGAISGADLYEWLQDLDLLSYLGCTE